MSASSVPLQPLAYLDKALNLLRDLGVLGQVRSGEAPVVALIEQIASLDQEKAVAIARTLSQASAFNEVVREHVTSMRVGERYEQIAAAFDSIRDDAKAMVDQLADGKLSSGERLSNIWMKITRGDIAARFDRIRATFLEVARDTQQQLERERAILEAYRDFRIALKESHVLALQLLEQAESLLEGAKQDLARAVEALKAASPDAETQARLELERDQRLRDVQDHDKRYQIAKDLGDNLSVGYNTTEVVMARLLQTTSCKERVYTQGVAFFSTNDTVLTALNASFTGLHGLHESTKTLDVMREGMNASLETLSEVGTDVQENALRAGLAPSLKVESVKKLVEAVVTFQQKSIEIVKEMRELSTKNEREIREVVEDGKRRFAQLLRTGEGLMTS